MSYFKYLNVQRRLKIASSLSLPLCESSVSVNGNLDRNRNAVDFIGNSNFTRGSAEASFC